MQKILFVDDEPHVVEAYQRALRGQFDMETALGGEQALALVREKGPFAVICSDMRMPGMDGVQFLAQAKKIAPESVRIMLTGNSDQQTAMDAVNEGAIFRFLTKPCSPENLAKALQAGIRQYRLLTSEKELQEKTLTGSVQILMDVLSIIHPIALGRAQRIKLLAREIKRYLDIEKPWQLEIAASLSQVGYVILPEKLMKESGKKRRLTQEEARLLHKYPKVGHDLIAHVPRLEEIAKIILYQEKLYDGSGFPHDYIAGNEIPIGARILKVLLDYDRAFEEKKNPALALNKLRERTGWYDPQVLDALALVVGQKSKYVTRHCSLAELKPGMILGENLVSARGLLLVPKGRELSSSLLLHLQNYSDADSTFGKIKILVPADAPG